MYFRKEKSEKRKDGCMLTDATIFYGYITIKRKTRLFVVYVWLHANWNDNFLWLHYN